jgi:hypothetical protein
MQVIREQGPSEHARLGGAHQRCESIHEGLPIVIIPKHRSPLDPARHHMMERSGNINAGTTGHDAHRTALYIVSCHDTL